MIDAGLPDRAVPRDPAGPDRQQVLRRPSCKDVKSSVEQGATFSDALRKHPKVFDPLYTNLVQAGEVGGILDTILNRLAVYIEKAMKLKRQVKGAMVYPTSVVVIFTGVLCVLLGFVIPAFENMFTDFGAKDELPALTQFVIDGLRGVHRTTSSSSSLVGCAVDRTRSSRIYKTPEGEEVLPHAILLGCRSWGRSCARSPSRASRARCGTLLSSGVPILDALDIVAKTAGNVIVEEAIMYARLKISEGKNMAGPLMETNVFPPMVVQMVGVGEQTGALDTMLNKIADFYEDEVDVAVAALTSLIEPVMMVGIGGTVGVVLIAMYLPIFASPARSRRDSRIERLGAGAASVRPEAGGDRALTGRLAAITGAAARLLHAPPRRDGVLLPARRARALPAVAPRSSSSRSRRRTRSARSTRSSSARGERLRCRSRTRRSCSTRSPGRRSSTSPAARRAARRRSMRSPCLLGAMLIGLRGRDLRRR